MIGRICQREVDTASANETVETAASRMQQRSVGALVILDPNGRPRGIVTDRDLVVRVIARHRDPTTTRIEEIMTSPVVTAGERTPIETVVERMRQGDFRRVPVVDTRGKLAGIAALDDILRLLAEELADVGLLLQRQSPSGAGLQPA